MKKTAEETPKTPDSTLKPGESDVRKEDNEFYERWKSPNLNKMGNDISSEIKIANSGGKMEGGSDKQWHMEEKDKNAE